MTDAYELVETLQRIITSIKPLVITEQDDECPSLVTLPSKTNCAVIGEW
jgi:hypothetical protein